MTIEEAIDVIDISPAYIGLEGVNKGCSYDEWNSAVSIAIEALQFQQSVVHCSRCSLWEYDDDYSNVGKCNYFSHEKLVHLTNRNDYCSSGERKDREE